jgi:capsule polysaccharide export protein KpsE/RkpR
MAIQIDLSFLRSRASQRRMASVWAGFVVLGLAYALLAPKWYVSSLSVVPARPSKASGLSSMLGGELGGLAAGLDSGSGSTADPQRIAAVLQSNAVADAVIEKFSLKTRYSADYIEDARDVLGGHCVVKTLPKPSVIQVTCEDKEPTFAKEMLTFLVQRGNEVFRGVSVSSASEEVRFLEARVAQLRNQADSTSDRMREFQETHGIVDLDTQARSVVSALAGLQGQRINKQLELEYAQTFSSGDESSIRALEMQLALVTAKVRSLEDVSAAPNKAADKKSARPGVFPKALEVPQLRAEFEKLYRDRRVAEASLIVSLERLENARANEARDVSTFVVMDPATLPTKKDRPRRTLILALSAMLGLLCSVTLEWFLTGGSAGLFREVTSRGGLPRGPVLTKRDESR